MRELVTESLGFAYAQVEHIVRMMYWVWVPGFLLSAFVSLRYRGSARAGLLVGGTDRFPAAVLRALWYGVTASPRPRSNRDDAASLVGTGASPAIAAAALVASRNLPPYVLAIVALLLGIEFAVGQVIATAVMAALVYGAVATFADGSARPVAAGGEPMRASGRLQGHDADIASWRELLLTRRGWARVLAYCWAEVAWFWPGLALGILLGGFVLAAGLTKWWIELADVAGGGIAADAVNAALGPLLGGLVSLPPVGNLPTAAALFKTDALAYPGFVGFVLASSIRLADLPAHLRLRWPAGAARLGGALYAAAVLGALAPVAAYALFGFRPGHIPLFRELVDEILHWIPFAMPSGGPAM